MATIARRVLFQGLYAQRQLWADNGLGLRPAESARRASEASRARRARVCALVPPPRFHWMRYLGVLVGHSSLRAEVVLKKPAAPPTQLPLFDEADEPAKSATKKTAEPSRHPWSRLLQRVFAVDILKCE
jgi:hypothetical protein